MGSGDLFTNVDTLRLPPASSTRTQMISPCRAEHGRAENGRVEDCSGNDLGLLLKLELSFECSQKALLSGNVTGLELHTADQARLVVELGAHAQHEPDARAQNRNSSADSDIAAELHAAAERVLHLGRVQGALLARAGQRLRMIANLLAGPQATYAAAVPQRREPASSTAGNANAIPALGREHYPCRA